MWSWQRSGLVFFPWFKADAAHRMPTGTASLEGLHAATVDFLRTGERYAIGYRAAFRLRMDATLRSMRVPLLITVADGDLLAPQLERIAATPWPACIVVEPGGSPEATLARCAAFLARHPVPTPPAPRQTTTLFARATNSFVQVQDLTLRLRRHEGGGGRPVVILHESIGSADVMDPLLASLAGSRPVIAMDLPGRGESETVHDIRRLSVTHLGACVVGLLEALGLSEVDVVGFGDGGLIGLDVAERTPERIGKLVFAGPALPAPELRHSLNRHCPLLEPDWHGGYLAEAWHFLRDRELYLPWFSRSNDRPVSGPMDLDPRRLTLGVLDLLRAGHCATQAQRACLDYELEAHLARAHHAPVLVGALEGIPGIEKALGGV
jgi:pimeloyl-ACP methyl ester carboxylesterase